MKTIIYLFSLCGVLFISSCSSEISDVVPSSHLSLRESSNMNVSFITLSQNNVYVVTPRIEIRYISNNTIELKTNAGMDNEQTYYTTSFTVAEPDYNMKVILNPNNNQSVYVNKYSLIGNVNEEGYVSNTILSGNIANNSTAIIIEESDTF